MNSIRSYKNALEVIRHLIVLLNILHRHIDVVSDSNAGSQNASLQGAFNLRCVQIGFQHIRQTSVISGFLYSHCSNTRCHDQFIHPAISKLTYNLAISQFSKQGQCAAHIFICRQITTYFKNTLVNLFQSIFHII